MLFVLAESQFAGNNTVSCSRDAPLSLTLSGANFGPPPMQIFVGGAACANPQQPSAPALQQRQAVCTLPAVAQGLHVRF